MIYEKKLSDSIKKLMWQVMKQADGVVQGFIFFRHRSIIKAHLDEDECSKLLESMVINKQNVLTYLKRKYVSVKIKDGLKFIDQNCIQKVIVKEDKTLFVHIKNSEPHKIITDTLHIMILLKDAGYDFIPEFKFFIEQVKIAFQDVMLYNLCLEEWGLKVPAPARVYERQLRKKYANLYDIAAIKKRSVKRKFARWLVKEEKILWTDLRKLLKIEDYSKTNVTLICNEIRADARARGVNVKF